MANIMVNKDPNILKPLNFIAEKLEEMEEILISLDLTMEKIMSEFQFKSDTASYESDRRRAKIRRLIRGGVFSRTQRKLAKLNQNDAQITDKFQFYTSLGGKLNPRSEFSQAKDFWVKTNKDNRKVYLSAIGLYLSYNMEGRIIEELKKKDYVERYKVTGALWRPNAMRSVDLEELRKKIASFISIVVKAKKEVKSVISDYKMSGLHQRVF